MRRFVLAAFLVSLLAAAPCGADCMQLFMKAKEQFRLNAYSETLATLEKLAQESEQPGNEVYRAQLRPGLAFYRAASLAALGKVEEARPEFEIFLTYQPNAVLDPGAFPSKVIATLEEVRRSLGTEAQKPAETGSLATIYRTYVPAVSKGTPEAADEWAESPVSYLLTARQRRDYSRLTGPVERSEFITEFWKTRDATPETPENEAREEFERRVAFADAQLAQDETRGSLTDRGLVFVMLGPPTWVGRRPLRTGEDTADPGGMSIYSDQDVANTLRGLSGSASAVTWDKMTGPGNRMPDSDGNYREVWHYRREQLPKGIPYHQVDFEFLTKEGYGQNVLQRETQVLDTLEKAKALLRQAAA